MKHPEKFPVHVYRGICHAVFPGTRLLFQLDLGFGIYHSLVGTLDNLSVPSIDGNTPSEAHAAEALEFRVKELVEGKSVLVIPYLHDAPVYPHYRFNVFYYLRGIKTSWHSLEDQLVREQHAAWLDERVPAPSIS